MQDDMEKLIAYSSVAHMGYVTLGIFTLQTRHRRKYLSNDQSWVNICSVILMCWSSYDRLHSRMISSYGGLVNYLPKHSLFLLFALAALGLPGTSGF